MIISLTSANILQFCYFSFCSFILYIWYFFINYCHSYSYCCCLHGYCYNDYYINFRYFIMIILLKFSQFILFFIQSLFFLFFFFLSPFLFLFFVSFSFPLCFSLLRLRISIWSCCYCKSYVIFCKYVRYVLFYYLFLIFFFFPCNNILLFATTTIT